MQNILAVDFEAWYHPEYVRKNADKPKDIEKFLGLNLLLDLLGEKDVSASFFIVGEIAEKYPEILKTLDGANHEIGFHSYDHIPLQKKTPSIFHKEVIDFSHLVKSQINKSPIGFRAPSYTVNNDTIWALKILKSEGYLYDASVFPVVTPLYGMKNVPFIPYTPSLNDLRITDPNESFIEYPASTYKVLKWRVPICGGFYLRILPLSFIKTAIKKINQKGYPVIISLHPWEVDPETPRLSLGLTKSFITYHNLKNMIKKISSLLEEFNFTCFRNIL